MKPKMKPHPSAIICFAIFARLAIFAVLAALVASLAPSAANAAAAAPAARAAAAPVTLAVDTRRTAQEILGFGASGCWWAQEIGGWPEAKRRELMRLLYDKKTGIGLTIYRHNLGADTLDDPTIGKPGSLHRAQSMLDTKTGRFDWSRDANARRILRDAVDAGAEEVILFVNSPPVSMTINGHGRGTKQPDGKKATNLAPARYADFAKYLGEITEHFLRADKLPIVKLSPVNEPNVGWDTAKQEGCFYTPQQTVGVLKAVLAELKRRDLPVTLEVAENATWKEAQPYFQAMRNAPVLRDALADFCLHSYMMEGGSSPANKQKLRDWFDKNCEGVRLHMSEWCDVRHGVGPDMDGALPMVRVMMQDLTIGRVSTWQQWVAASNVESHDALVHYDSKTRKITLTKRYWVMGQFSRNLPKGTVMLGMKSPDANAPALAARRPDGSVVVICANLSAAPKTLDIQFPKNENWNPQTRSLTDDKNDNTVSACESADADGGASAGGASADDAVSADGSAGGSADGAGSAGGSADGNASAGAGENADWKTLPPQSVVAIVFGKVK